jgi:MFS family permease
VGEPDEIAGSHSVGTSPEFLKPFDLAVKVDGRMHDDGTVLLVFFGVFAVLTVPMAGGNLWRLADVRLRGQWLVAVALAAQVLFITILPGRLEGVHAPVHLFTYALAAAFVWANRAIAGVWLMGIGAAANFAAIAANGGVMPASEEALADAGMVADKGEAFANSAAVEGARLAPLGDVFAIPASWPLSNVFSIGDVVIGIGLLVSLHVICRSRLVWPVPSDLRAVIREPPFARLWGAQIASAMGDFIYSLAIAVTVVDEDLGASLLATILIAQAAPAAVCGLLGAPLIDLVSRKRLMIAADVARAAAVGSLLLSDSPSSLHIVLVAACLGTFGALFQPALYSSLPNLVSPRLLLTANATLSATFHLAVLVGPLVGALIATHADVEVAFAVNAASFVFSALLLTRLRVPPVASPARRANGVQALGEGLRYVAGSALVRGVAITAGLAMLAGAMRQPLEPAFILEDLGGTVGAVGSAVAAWGVGMLFGSCAVPALERRWGACKLMATGLAAMGVATVVASQAGDTTLVYILWMLGGWGNALLTVAYETLLQQRTPDALRGRVVAANEAVLDAALVVGLAVAGVGAAALGTRGVMVASGGLLLVSALLVPILLRARAGAATTSGEHSEGFVATLLAPAAPPATDAASAASGRAR